MFSQGIPYQKGQQFLRPRHFRLESPLTAPEDIELASTKSRWSRMTLGQLLPLGCDGVEPEGCRCAYDKDGKGVCSPVFYKSCP